MLRRRIPLLIALLISLACLSACTQQSEGEQHPVGTQAEDAKQPNDTQAEDAQHPNGTQAEDAQNPNGEQHPETTQQPDGAHHPQHLEVSYNTHTFEMHSDLNKGLSTDIRSFWIDGEVYFVVPHDMPEVCTVTIIDESDYTAHDEEVSIDSIKSINDINLHIIRSNLPVMYISLDHSVSDTPYIDLNSQETQKNVDYHGVMELNNSGAPAPTEDQTTNKNPAQAPADTDNRQNPNPNTAQTPSTHYNITLSRHGNASWDMCGKHSYNLKLSEKDSLLGLYNSKSYSLIANGKDKTLLRNYMANELAKELGCKYTANMKFVTLYVDTMYCGVYLLTEKPKKVMDKALPDNPETFAINVMSVDKDYVIPFSMVNHEFDGDEGQSEGSGISANMILPEQNQLNYDYYAGKVQQLFDEIGTGNFDNVDTDSFIKYYFMQEITKNYDAWYRSLYLIYNAETGKWEAGTPWDFDMSWNYFAKDSVMDFYTPEGSVACHGIYADLYINDSVKERIIEFYNAEVRPSVKKLRKDMHETYDYIRTDADLDYRYINTDRNIPICGEEWFDITFGTSYDNAFENFVDYFDKRNEYLEGEFRPTEK